MSDATVKRIDALTANARSTWLGLFSVLVFAVVTLVSVEHIERPPCHPYPWEPSYPYPGHGPAGLYPQWIQRAVAVG